MDVPMRDRDILLTGFPSFLARKVLETILENESDSLVRLLVLPSLMGRAEEALDELDPDPERIDLLEGDVVSIDLGLSGTEYLDLATNVTDIYHIASIWYLGVEHDEISEVNVGGVRNIIDAASEMEQLERLNHLSTAFVCGDRTGVMLESELDCGQSFRNAYEETKFQAEKAIRRAMDQLPIAVFRPSIVVGDSTTGEIDRMAGPYYLMQAIMQMPDGLPTVMPGRGDAPLNMVPADYVARAMHAISLHPEADGETFHLTDPNPLAARTVFEIVADRLDRSPPVGHMPYRLTKWLMKFPFLEKLTRDPRQFLDDFNQLTVFNAMNTDSLVGDEIRCPPFPSYVDALIEYIRHHDVGEGLADSTFRDILELAR